jgi:hypothetical protein
MGNDVRTDLWVDRIRTLEVALARCGRTDLSRAVLAIKEALVDAAHVDELRDSTLALVADAVKDLRACVLDSSRAPDDSIVDALARLRETSIADDDWVELEDVEEPSKRTGSIRPPRRISYSAAPLAEGASLQSIAESSANTSPAKSLPEDPPSNPSHSPTTPAPSDHMAAETLLAGLAALETGNLDGLVENLVPHLTPETDELGTMRSPLVKGSPDARVLMKGELHPGLLTDLVQLFAQNAETGRLVLREETSRRMASIFFDAGKIVDAALDGGVGEDAFMGAMAIRRGLFSYQRGVKADHIRISRSTKHLLFESLRLLDESPPNELAPAHAPSPEE